MISFETKEIPLPDLNYAKIEIWLGEIAANHQKRIGNLNYLFCSDQEILRVNKEFLKHDYFTDIITFDYSHKDKVSGDIFISIETVKSNAMELKEPYNKELLRVIAHGILHLCGINDKCPGEREIMEAEENKALTLWESIIEK